MSGGTSVNAQAYMRGRPDDYSGWHKQLINNSVSAGCPFKKVLPYFRELKNNDRLNDFYHGQGGPLQVSDPGRVDVVSRFFSQSVQTVGVPFTSDFNGTCQTGVGFYQFMNRAGKRCSTACLRHHPDLTLKLNAKVQCFVITNGRVIGVECRDHKGSVQVIKVRGEVILAASALVMPKLLKLSGLRSGDELRRLDIDIEVELPDVGENLIDHPEVPITAYSRSRSRYYRQGQSLRILRNGLQFKMFGGGPIASAGVEAGTFVNPGGPQDLPSIQAFCVPTVYLDSDAVNFAKDGYGMTITTVVIKPKARGSVRLRSAHPADMPLVSPNLLGHPDDMQVMVTGRRFFLRTFDASPLKCWRVAVQTSSPCHGRIPAIVLELT
ncbi:GMC family oxidoreductase [Cobetia amphilecti]|uniref:GMC family oxidoreductase n=1 Tax=Cobetia amphilecti TaxID=1055104 RepID=UPI0012EB18FE|nr:GMC family oxidoreductase [Cobetia amphilecti]